MSGMDKQPDRAAVDSSSDRQPCHEWNFLCGRSAAEPACHIRPPPSDRCVALHMGVTCNYTSALTVKHTSKHCACCAGNCQRCVCMPLTLSTWGCFCCPVLLRVSNCSPLMFPDSAFGMFLVILGCVPAQDMHWSKSITFGAEWASRSGKAGPGFRRLWGQLASCAGAAGLVEPSSEKGC
jgi:hypothetical protein